MLLVQSYKEEHSQYIQIHISTVQRLNYRIRNKINVYLQELTKEGIKPSFVVQPSQVLRNFNDTCNKINLLNQYTIYVKNLK